MVTLAIWNDVYASAVHVGVISQSTMPGEFERYRWTLRLGQSREFEGVAHGLEAAQTAMRDAWLTWCEMAGVRPM